MRPLLDRARSRAAAVPLRVRLVALLLALALAALTVTGAVAVAQLRGQLTNTVDAQLRGVAANVGDLDGPPGRGRRLPTSQYVVFLPDAGTATPLSRLLPSAGSGPDLGRLSASTVTRYAGRPFTVAALKGDNTWRCVALRGATQTTDGTLSDGTLVVAQSLSDVEATVHRMGLVLLLVGLVVLLALAALGWFAVRRAFRPLGQVEQVAGAIAAGDLSRRVPSNPPSTEVGRLSAALNAMLGQIEQAFAVREASEQRMRRFVSDASHELRTPLATVRGYAELYRQGAVTQPSDVALAMRRIETEATRMGGLVEDLLTLARLDEQRPQQGSAHGRAQGSAQGSAQGEQKALAPLDPLDLVDLTVLAADAVHDARALDPGRAVTLGALGGELGPVVVEGDEPRLRQVVTNLLANALRHTPAGTPVEVRVGADDGSGVLQVADHGPGIAPEHARAVFERFFRADASRQRGQGGGSGLGLAIVAAIVAAHHGQVGVVPTKGGGATFLVRLPLRATEVRPSLTAGSQVRSSA